MSWDAHGGRRYYTRSSRKSGKVVRQYIGRRERLRQQALRREEKAADDRLDDQVVELCLLAETAAAAALLDAGYHNHKGQWRKRRGNGN